MTSQSIDPSTPNEGGRVFFRDVKPYAIVDDLDQLRGPAGGVVELSHSARTSIWTSREGPRWPTRPCWLRVPSRTWTRCSTATG